MMNENNRLHPAIQVTDLTFQYPDGHVALKGISFKVNVGESIALLGANGAGKSTLLLCLVGILKGTGSIRILGVELTPENAYEVRRHTGFVFQNPEHQLFSTSVLDDVLFGPLNLGVGKEEALARADKILQKLNMSHFRRRAPHHLSQGEKKKVALATALAMEPELLLLDEPTAGLDPRSATQFIDILFDLKDEGKTMLLATHDMHLADEMADRIAVLGENSGIVREGAPREILTDTDFLERHNLVHAHSHCHARTRHQHPHLHLHYDGNHLPHHE
jgi:cobalt/nickel transport system ATP-binding protein